MLVLGPDGGAEDRGVIELPELLSPGDLLVVNDTRVMPARLKAHRATGGAIELLCLGIGAPATGEVDAMVRPGRRLKLGETLDMGEGKHATLLARHEDGSWRVRFTDGLGVPMAPLDMMEGWGSMPLPPYIARPDEASDRERYQTVYAREPGAVAAPTAGLHLGPGLLAALATRGVELAMVTLHVGAGTFRNLRPEDMEAGRLHTEAYEVPAATVAKVAATRVRGGKVVAVGTTSTRSLESAALGGTLRAGAGTTDLFIQPGFRFQVVDRLLTNFHLPRSSLLMLVGAFVGRQRLLATYAHAIEAGYRFYSYGDAMLVDPCADRATG